MKQKSIYLVILFSIVVLFQINYAYSQQKHEHSSSSRQQLEQREERFRDRWYWQMPNRVFDEIGIKPGQVIADVGCGIGYFSLRLAERIGESGMVYASDIDKEALQYLGERCKKLGIQNIQLIQGDENDPLLPKASIDLVLIVNTINFVENSSLFLKNLKSSLKSGGLVAVIQWDAEKMDSEMPEWSPDNRRQFTQQTMLRTIYDADYEVLRILDFLPMQRIYVCQPRIDN
jgi:ubiquinone/menaquinone biosynthesis C-methylase UbiE